MEKACYLQWQMNDIGNKVRNKSQTKGTFLTVISAAQLKANGCSWHAKFRHACFLPEGIMNFLETFGN